QRASSRGVTLLLECAGTPYFTASFRDFKARILITRRAGLALNICSCFVKGLIPLRAGTAGLLIVTILSSPDSTKIPGPFLLTFFLASSPSASMTDATCLRESVVVPEMLLRISLLLSCLAMRVLSKRAQMNPQNRRHYAVPASRCK